MTSGVANCGPKFYLLSEEALTDVLSCFSLSWAEAETKAEAAGWMKQKEERKMSEPYKQMIGSSIRVQI